MPATHFALILASVLAAAGLTVGLASLVAGTAIGSGPASLLLPAMAIALLVRIAARRR